MILEERTYVNRFKKKLKSKYKKLDKNKKNGSLKKINLGMIGLGNVAKWAYLPKIAQSSEFVLKSVYDCNESATKEIAESFNSKACSSVDELINDSSIDAVLICTPPTFHHDAIEKAVAANKHILCEKPMCDSFENSKNVWDIIQNKDIVHMIHFSLRFKPMIQFLIDIIHSGTIGRICHVHGSYVQAGWFSEDGTPSKKRNDASDWQYEDGGGVLRDLSPHVIDLSRVCFGEITKVNGNCSSLRTDNKNITSDVCVFDLEATNGALIQWTISRWGVMEIGQQDNISLEVNGTKGRITLSNNNIKISTIDNSRERNLLVPSHYNTNFIDRFYQSIINNKKNEFFPTFKDGYMASQIAHHIHNNQMSKVTIK